ncbi:hypothetical protein [Candidatus Burkholderia verschuerenii]|uniref:hypothetical protein n=1 Tax=Candidatus Burkholderia verschuerenii TaxID=242163 RepID=UPI000AF9C860|nr:hypothetical protein [Candidatus Burkholderia verschuerenii]
MAAENPSDHPRRTGLACVETMPNNRTESRPVAAWALLDTDEVVGLLPHKFGGTLELPQAKCRFTAPGFDL